MNQNTRRNSLNARELPKDRETNYQPSLTIQGDSMSIKTIMERYARGLPVSGSHRTEVYHGDEELPDLERMDLSEIHDLAEQNQQQIKSYADFQKRQAEEAFKQKERKLEAMQKELEEYRKKYPKSEPAPQPNGVPNS